MGTQVSITVKVKVTNYLIPDEVKSQDSSDHAPTPHPDHPIKRASSTPVAAATIKKQKKVEKVPPKKFSPKPSYFEVLIQANGLFNSRRYTEAHTLYEKVLHEDPHHLTALYRQSVCFWKRGFINQALQNLKEILARCPKDAEALATKGAIQIQKSRFVTAVEDLKKSASLKPSSDFIQSVLLESCYYAFRQPPEIATRDPEELKVEDLSLLKAIKLASRNDYTSAVQELSKTMPTDPNTLSSKVLALFKERIQDLSSNPAQGHLSTTKISPISITAMLNVEATPIA